MYKQSKSYKVCKRVLHYSNYSETFKHIFPKRSRVSKRRFKKFFITRFNAEDIGRLFFVGYWKRG